MIIISSLNRLAHQLSKLTRRKLWLQVIIAIILGVSLGIFLNPENGYISLSSSKVASEWLNLPGVVFLRLVQMVMIPLVFTSIILGIVSNNTDNLKRFGLRLLSYFLFTTIIAIVIGLAISFLMAPGDLVKELGGLTAIPDDALPTEQIEQISVPGAISNLIPSNPLSSMLTGEMLGVVVFTVIIGIAITQLQVGLARPLVKVSEAIQNICMTVVSWAMMLVPYAVFGLMAALVMNIGYDVLIGLGYYMIVVVIGLVILLIAYLIILFLFTGTKPIKFLSQIKDVLLLAFSTASSAAVMPLTMETADKKLGVSSQVSDFVVPIGATINMDGTALFQCVTAIFLAQAYGIEMSFMTLILIVVTMIGASIGTPAIPGGGVIILASVLGGIGVPTDGLIVIVGVDRILGMFRTTINVTGDLVACMVFNKWFGEAANDEGQVVLS